MKIITDSFTVIIPDANTIDESDVIMNLDELGATLIYDAESDEI